MKEFFLILFFAKTVLLTAGGPVYMGSGDTVIELTESISAITSGASVQIDISSTVQWGDESISSIRERLHGKYPSGSISAVLFSKDYGEVKLAYTGSVLISKDRVLLSLYSADGMPLGVEFHKIVVSTEVDLKDVLVFWRNYKK